MPVVTKDTAKQLIDSLPDDASFDEIMHVLYVNAKSQHGEQEIREGKGVPHEEAKRRLKKWLR
jgi:hypothetical protein